MMQVNIQHVFDEQKANFDHFNELNLTFEHHSQDFKYFQGLKNRGVRQFEVNSNKYSIVFFQEDIGIETDEDYKVKPPDL